MAQVAAGEWTFEHSAGFHAGEVSGNLQLDAYEEIYEKLFVEVLEDGVITPEERVRLEKAATSLGLDRSRLAELERALTSGYEVLHGRRVLHAEAALQAAPAGPVPAAGVEGASAEAELLRHKVATLEAQIVALEVELEHARAQRDVEVDLSLLDKEEQPAERDDPEVLHRRLRHDPRDVSTLRSLYRAHEQRGDLDAQWRTAQTLFHLGGADEPVRRFFAEHEVEGLIRPSHSLTTTAWQRYLFHPDDEILTGQIFAAIASAVLLGRVAALRRTGALPPLDPRQLENPSTSTVQAVRCFAWGASLLGMGAPPLYVDPSLPMLVQMVPGVPPASRIGRLALSGRKPPELAFVAGRYLAGFREERFLRQLFPDVLELQDLFVAGLIIANPALPVDAETKLRVQPVARAIEPLLQPPQIQRLRTLFARFVEEGGRANLQRWVRATDCTALRAGLLLCNDLGVAESILRLEGDPQLEAKMNDLIEFCTSQRYGLLRAELGIAVGATA
jgi:hypothetical protein